MRRFVASAITLALIASSLSPALAHHKPGHTKGPKDKKEAKKDEDKKEEVKKETPFKVQNLQAFISEINVTEKFVLIRQGSRPGAASKGKNKKVLADKAVIVKGGKDFAISASLSDLVKDEKATMIVKQERGSGGEFSALVIFQTTSIPLADFTLPTVQFQTSSGAGVESVTGGNVQVTLSKASTKEVKFTYAVSGTATGAGTDFSLNVAEVVIPAGQTSASIPFAIVGDTVSEPDETVVVTLNSANNAELGSAKIFTYTIQDDDQPRVQFGTLASSGAENAPLANLQVNLTAASAVDVKVNYTVAGTATGSGTDYTMAAGQAIIVAGQTSVNLPIVVVDDSAFEGDETVVVTLTTVVGAVLGTNVTYTYTIQDNDQPRVGFSSATSSGGENVASVNIPVTLSVASAREARVSYAVTGTALGAGTDYTLANGTVVIAAGQTTTNLSFTVADDALDEVDETVIITLSSPIDAVIGTTTAHTYTITDNDQPTVQFSLSASNGAEAATPVNLAVALSAVAVKDAKVSYVVTGTATGGGADYTLANGDLTIAAGQLTGNITLAIVNDAVVEPNETVIVTISNPIDATLGTNTVHTYTINNDD